MTGLRRYATISDCGQYRYRLSRVWDGARQLLTFVMLNPSTADAEQDDPTIRRCMGFARTFGYGGINVLNIFALRATDPRQLSGHPDPVGPYNDQMLYAYLAVDPMRAQTVAAWGAHKAATVRAAALTAPGTAPWSCLGVTKDGHPRHPLYLPANAQLRLWRPVVAS
jgi:hypothetical protein